MATRNLKLLNWRNSVDHLQNAGFSLVAGLVNGLDNKVYLHIF